MVKFSTKKPPVYDRCVKLSGVDWDGGLIITYGDTIHSKEEPYPDFVVHELVHVKQQEKMGPEAWWNQYFSDKYFRKTQEYQAYREQMNFINNNIKDRNQRAKMKHFLARDLSHNYGGICTMQEAMEMLTI